MLLLLPLLSSLSSLPAVSATTYSTSDNRTLQAAVNSALHSKELRRFHQQCKEQTAGTDEQLNFNGDKAYPRLQQLLKDKVFRDQAAILSLDTKLTRQLAANIVVPKDCADSQRLQTLMDNYEMALFALEIAMPLENNPVNNIATEKRRNQQVQASVKQLIAQSSAIGLATVVEKKQLNAIQQANHLHPDYSSDYIFKVQQGWRGAISPYLGMHINISDKEVAQTAKEWLIFLDRNGHFIKAIAKEQAKPYLSELAGAEWRYDSNGQFYRN